MPAVEGDNTRTAQRTYAVDARRAVVIVTIVASLFPRTLLTIGKGTTDYETSTILFIADLPLLALIAIDAASWRKRAVRRAVGAGTAGWLALTVLLMLALVSHPSARGAVTVLRLLGVVALADQVRQFGSSTGRRAVVIALGSCAAAETAIAVAQRINNGPIGLGRLGEDVAPLYRDYGSPAPQGTMVHIYVLAGLALVAGTALARFAVAEQARGLWLAAVALAIAPIGFTYSRAGLLGLVLAETALLVGWPSLPFRRRVGLAVAAALGLGALIPAVVWSGGWRSRAHQSVGATSSISTNRSQLNHEAWTLITHNPIVGVGPGRYVIALQQRQHVEADKAVGIFKPVHDLPLLAAAEGGALAGLAIAGLLGLVGWRAMRTDCGALAVYLSLLPFLLLDHFAYSLPQGLVILALWLGFLDGWYADRSASA